MLAGAARFAGATDADLCGRCHITQAALAASAGGHAVSLDCITCHGERRPNRVGRGHRTIPTSCTSHHATAVETHPLTAHAVGPGKLSRSCLKCHDPHGSTNDALIRTALRTRGRYPAVDFRPTQGGGPGFVDPLHPGQGLCEVCHRTTRFYRANGKGEDHYTGDCALCHDHAAGFAPVVSDANCAICHPDQASLFAKQNLHHDEFAGKCSSCHAEVSPDPGPGHRAKSACTDCHSATRVADHVPPGIRIACTQCHEPHGTDNIRLVRDVIHATNGGDVPLQFDDLTGRADGSFASASVPGTGLCEVCHTRTLFYRANGTGAPHYTTMCLTCHPHEAGFLPQ